MEWQLLASGCGIAEAPTVDRDGRVYFSDITKGGVYRISDDSVLELMVPKRKGVGGLALHASGGIVTAGRDITHVRDGGSRQLAGPADFRPQEGYATSFNDFAVGPAGDLYVGTIRTDHEGRRAPGEYARVSAPHEVDVVIEAVAGANGAAVTADGSYLVAADSEQRTINVASLRSSADGKRGAHAFSTAELPGVPDGLALSTDGSIWVAFYQGGCLGCWSLDGRLIDKIDAPGQRVTSLCFDPVSKGDVIVTTADNTGQPNLEGCVFRAALDLQGLPVPCVTL